MPVRVLERQDRREKGLVNGGFDCLRSCVWLSPFTSERER